MNTYELDQLIRSEVSKARRDEAQECASMLDLRASEIMLMAGEMTPAEIRTVQAVLSGLMSLMRRRHDDR